ncbi:ABC transporter permease [Candidatus Microgenomates bacterium]|nr:ABC transporter permease [Candidatus Microgenomates bacterium]
MKKLFNVAKFEYLKTVKKASFWASTLFLPLFIGFVSFVSGYSSIDSMEKMENMETFSTIYVIDEAKILPDQMFVSPLKKVNTLEEVKSDIMSDSQKVLIKIPNNFLSDLKYEVYLKQEGDILRSANVPLIADSLIKNSAISTIQNEASKIILSGSTSSTTFSFDKDGVMKQEGFEQFVLPIVSLVVFFMAVFISSSFLLQSVSAEKENRMIETMLSIVDKKSLMF